MASIPNIQNLSESHILDIDQHLIDSFKVKDELCPSLWTRAGKLKHFIRRRLEKIGLDFFDYLKIGWVEVEDILLTGSLANYNWSEYSDIDLHVLVDASRIDKNAELAEEYLTDKKTLWNNKFHITIAGFEVELYAQNINDQLHSAGVYSVLQDKWLVEPGKDKPLIDSKEIEFKSKRIVRYIRFADKLYHDGEYERVVMLADQIKEKLRKYRKAGLSGVGEYSTENLVFKTLRRSGYMDHLHELAISAYNKEMSIP